MQKIAKQSIIFFIIAALVFIPFGTSVLAQTDKLPGEISAGAMAADLAFARPLGLVALVLGSAIFIVSLPFSALGGNAKDASQKLVVDPAKFTFKRPLGDF